MPQPPAETLYEHLSALRDAADPTDPRHDRRWREVRRWLEQVYGREGEDVLQEVLASLIRHVGGMRAQTPREAASWVLKIARRKRIDAFRAQARDPVGKALRDERARPDAPYPLEQVAADESPDARLLEETVTMVLEHVDEALRETVPNAAKRLLRRTQAEATLLRLVYDQDAEAIAASLRYGEPLSRDRIYKWIERGRTYVLAGLEHWERVVEEDDRPDALRVIAVLREILVQRRADAGVPRPTRRRTDGAEEDEQ